MVLVPIRLLWRTATKEMDFAQTGMLLTLSLRFMHKHCFIKFVYILTSFLQQITYYMEYQYA